MCGIILVAPTPVLNTRTDILMYPQELAIIKKFVTKFDSNPNQITVFIREYRLRCAGVEDKMCSTGTHQMHVGQTAYVYNGWPFGLDSAYCSTLNCFLAELDADTVQRYHDQRKRNRVMHKITSTKNSLEDHHNENLG